MSLPSSGADGSMGGYAELTASWMTPRYDTAAATNEERFLYCRILLLVEALFESLPQAAVQTVMVFIYSAGSIQLNLYLFSMTCSFGVAGFALMNFAQYRASVMMLLRPPKQMFAVNLAAQCDEARVDAATLLADIAAARDAGVSDAEVFSAVQRLQETRVDQLAALRANGCAPGILIDAGYTVPELYAAGCPAVNFRAAGIALAQLESLGFSLHELRQAGFSAAELHAEGHALASLVRAGATAAELKTS